MDAGLVWEAAFSQTSEHATLEPVINLPPDIAIRWLTFMEDEAEQWEALLAPDEYERMRAFKLAKRRREFLMGRVAARTLLAERLRIEPAHVPLHVTEGGCIDVMGTDLAVSIAHSGEHAVAAVGERAVGIDLERIAPRHPGLRRFLLHPEEEDAFDTLALDETHACMLYWTLKEAALKALGTGFRFSPKKVRAAIDLAQESAVLDIEGGPVFEARFEQRAGYFVAVAFDYFPGRIP